ncbi:MAG TPA: L-threonylcarbamoyladenylate synthase [Candidatus Dormibacteraeota bacterium]|nr:L-threonylcarbamoyladenylate synthase [Candidatus Dormibacteraeota bacterium]
MPSPRVLPAQDPSARLAALRAIEAGELVAVPTETVYGLTCAPRDEALARLVAAKGRPIEKGITLLVDGLEMARTVGALPPVAERLAAHWWPGPLTLVVPVAAGVELPRLITGGGDMVGLRVPDLDATRELATAAGPLPLTSANRSGEPEARSASRVVAELGDAVALVLDGGIAPGGVPSTVVACAEDGLPDAWRILRPGALDAAEIAAWLAT